MLDSYRLCYPSQGLDFKHQALLEPLVAYGKLAKLAEIGACQKRYFFQHHILHESFIHT